MKIVDRKTFLSMPEGTVFAKYEPYIFDNLCIKGETIEGNNDFFYQQIVDSLDVDNEGEFVNKLDDSAAEGKSLSYDFGTETRDGFFDVDQLFAVWEPEDVVALVKRLEIAIGTNTDQGEKWDIEAR